MNWLLVPFHKLDMEVRHHTQQLNLIFQVRAQREMGDEGKHVTGPPAAALLMLLLCGFFRAECHGGNWAQGGQSQTCAEKPSHKREKTTQ